MRWAWREEGPSPKPEDLVRAERDYEQVCLIKKQRELRDLLPRPQRSGHSLDDSVLNDPWVKKLWNKTGLHVWKTEVTGVLKERLVDYGSYLWFYNCIDVECLMPMIDQMTANYRQVEPDIEIGIDSISLPHVARIIPHKSISEDHHAVFHLPKGDVEGQLLERATRHNLFGRPSIIFAQKVEAFITRLPSKEVIKKMLTMDANTLYSWAMMQELPRGPSTHYYRPDDFALPPVAETPLPPSSSS